MKTGEKVNERKRTVHSHDNWKQENLLTEENESCHAGNVCGPDRFCLSTSLRLSTKPVTPVEESRASINITQPAIAMKLNSG